MYGYEYYIFIVIFCYYLIYLIAYSNQDKKNTKQYLYTDEDILPVLI